MSDPLIKLGPDGQTQISSEDIHRWNLGEIVRFTVQLLGLATAALFIASAL